MLRESSAVFVAAAAAAVVVLSEGLAAILRKGEKAGFV
jgi:hypothetical protein